MILFPRLPRQERDLNDGVPWDDEAQEEDMMGDITCHPVGDRCLECGDVCRAFPNRSWDEVKRDGRDGGSLYSDVSIVRRSVKTKVVRANFTKSGVAGRVGCKEEAYRKYAILNEAEVLKESGAVKFTQDLVKGVPSFKTWVECRPGEFETVYVYPKWQNCKYRTLKVTSFMAEYGKTSHSLEPSQQFLKDQADNQLDADIRASDNFSLHEAILRTGKKELVTIEDMVARAAELKEPVPEVFAGVVQGTAGGYLDNTGDADTEMEDGSGDEDGDNEDQELNGFDDDASMSSVAKAKEVLTQMEMGETSDLGGVQLVLKTWKSRLTGSQVMHGHFDKRRFNGFNTAIDNILTDKNGIPKQLTSAQTADVKLMRNYTRYLETCGLMHSSKLNGHTRKETSEYITIILKDDPNFEWPVATSVMLVTKECTFLHELGKLKEVVDAVYPLGTSKFDARDPRLSGVRVNTRSKLVSFVKVIFEEIILPMVALGEEKCEQVVELAQVCLKKFDGLDFVSLDTLAAVAVTDWQNCWQTLLCLCDAALGGDFLEQVQAVADMKGQTVKTAATLLIGAIEDSSWYSDRMDEYLRTAKVMTEHGPSKDRHAAYLAGVKIDEENCDLDAIAKDLTVICKDMQTWGESRSGFLDSFKDLLETKVLECCKVPIRKPDSDDAVLKPQLMRSQALLMEASAALPLSANIPECHHDVGLLLGSVTESLQTIVVQSALDGFDLGCADDAFVTFLEAVNTAAATKVPPPVQFSAGKASESCMDELEIGCTETERERAKQAVTAMKPLTEATIGARIDARFGLFSAVEDASAAVKAVIDLGPSPQEVCEADRALKFKNCADVTRARGRVHNATCKVEKLLPLHASISQGAESVKMCETWVQSVAEVRLIKASEETKKAYDFLEDIAKGKAGGASWTEGLAINATAPQALKHAQIHLLTSDGEAVMGRMTALNAVLDELRSALTMRDPNVLNKDQTDPLLIKSKELLVTARTTKAQACILDHCNTEKNKEKLRDAVKAEVLDFRKMTECDEKIAFHPGVLKKLNLALACK